ncbi:hypothetical protein B0H21DRAFT_734930 [Amylocystis lapponica]|nr:hypothetical protein B0H21DRAFT_734930 [Amylocystis lapponica]
MCFTTVSSRLFIFPGAALSLLIIMILYYTNDGSDLQSPKDSISPGSVLEGAVLDFLNGDDPETPKQREPSPPPPYQPVSLSYPDEHSPLPSPGFSPLPTPAFPSGLGMLAQQSRPIPRNLFDDPAFSTDPRINPHFVVNPGGPSSSHSQLLTPNIGQVPRSLQPGRFPPTSETPHRDRSPNVIPPTIVRHAPISASSAFPLHDIWHPPPQSASSSASSSTSSISLPLPETTPETSARTTPSPPSSSPPSAPTMLESQPRMQPAIPQASASIIRPMPPVHTTSAPDLHSRPPPPPNTFARSVTAPTPGPAPVKAQTSSRSHSKRNRHPSVTALPDLDRIDELDESDPRGLAWHHGGPYEAARRAQQQAAERAESRAKQPTRHKPVDPSISSFSIQPGQIFPSHQLYHPPLQQQVPPRHAFFPQPTSAPPPQNLPPRLANPQFLLEDPYRREHIPARTQMPPPPPPHEQAPRFETPSRPDVRLPDPRNGGGVSYDAGRSWTPQPRPPSVYESYNSAPLPQGYDPNMNRQTSRPNVPPRHAVTSNAPLRDAYNVGPSAQPQRDPFNGVPLAPNVREARNSAPPPSSQRDSYIAFQNPHARSVEDLQRALPANGVIPRPDIAFPPHGAPVPNSHLPPRHRPKQLVMPLPLQPMETLRHQQLQMQHQQGPTHTTSASLDMGLARAQTYDSAARAQKQYQGPTRSQSQNTPQGRAKDIPMAPGPNVLRKRGTLSGAPVEVPASNVSAAMFAATRNAAPAPPVGLAPAYAESAKPAHKGLWCRDPMKEEAERDSERRSGRKLSKRK